MSADCTNNVVSLAGHFREKRWAKALAHLCHAYEANLATEKEVLEALIQLGWEDDDMSPEERAFCNCLSERADALQRGGADIRQIMRSIAGENYDGSSD